MDRELHLSNITDNYITLWRQREAYTFRKDGESTYIFDNDKLTVEDDGKKNAIIYVVHFQFTSSHKYSDLIAESKIILMKFTAKKHLVLSLFR